MKPAIAVIVSNMRNCRYGEKPARWIDDIAAARDDLAVELVDPR
jgi:hypothetical protein